MSVNEISTIRDILVGPQIQALEDRIVALEQQLRAAESKNDEVQAALNQQLEAKASASGADLQLAETKWQNQLEALKVKLENQIIKHRTDIGKTLVELGNSLIEKE